LRICLSHLSPGFIAENVVLIDGTLLQSPVVSESIGTLYCVSGSRICLGDSWILSMEVIRKGCHRRGKVKVWAVCIGKGHGKVHIMGPV
jgi:hypothetical protein